MIETERHDRVWVGYCPQGHETRLTVPLTDDALPEQTQTLPCEHCPDPQPVVRLSLTH